MPVTIVVSNRLRIEGLKRKDREAIASDLTYDNPAFLAALRHSGRLPNQIFIPRKLSIVKKSGSVIEVPRGYTFSAHKLGQRCFDSIKNANVVDERRFKKIKKPYPKLLIQPTKKQEDALAKFVNDINSDSPNRPFGTYLNVLEVSSGKTILGALMAMQVKQKTLVLVHTQLIMDTWINDLCKMFGKEYRSKIGIIQGKKATVGEHFTIAMNQTWSKRKQHWNAWWREFGCMIFDENHLCPAKTFFQCANESPAAFRIGLTGTPKRKDRLHPVMYNVFGRAFIKTKGNKNEIAETSIPLKDVVPVMTETNISDLEEKKITYRLNGKLVHDTVKIKVNPQKDYVYVLKALCKDSDRTALIARLVRKILKEDQTNSVLIATHRKSHASKIRRKIKKIFDTSIALLTGNTERARIQVLVKKLINRKIRCAVATIQLIKTGASIPPFNRLVIATPIGGAQDLEQIIGRIRRKEVKKKDAIVYHVVDKNVGMCKRHFYTRAVPFYRDVLRIPRFKDTFTA